MKKILTTILLLTSLLASAEPFRFTPLPMDSSLRYGILPNGMTYYIKHNETTKDRANFYIVQNVGAILEEDSQNGLAHFLEHMAFQGTKNLPGKMIIEYLETVGVKFGANINAYTSLDETVYNLDAVPTYRQGIIDTALTVLHDWSSFLTLDDNEIDKERGVIVEEWRTRNKANRRLWTASLPILFKNSQYAKRNVIGDTSIIKNFKYDTLRAYYKKWYRPDLQAIIIVGDINVDNIENQIKSLFADISKPENPTPRPIFQIEDNDSPIVAVLTDPEATRTIINIDYRQNPMSDELRSSAFGYFISTARNIIISAINNRLEEITQEKDSPISSISISYGELVKSRDAFSFYIIPNEGRERDAYNRLLTEISRLKRWGLSEAEVDREKLDLLSAIEKSYNERNKASNKSYVDEYKRNFLDFEPVPGIEWEYKTQNELQNALTTEVINSLLKEQMFGEENISILATGPDRLKNYITEDYLLTKFNDSKSIVVAPYCDNFTNAPLISENLKSGKVKNKKVDSNLGFTLLTLSNGMRIAIKQTDYKDDEILMTAFADGGLSAIDEKDLISARIACDVVENNGLGDFNSIALRKALAGKNISISPRIHQYEQNLSGTSSVKDFETLLQLLRLYLTKTRSDDNTYNALLNQYKTALSNRRKDPNSEFSDSINATVFGHNKRLEPLDTLNIKKASQDNALKCFNLLFHNPADFTVVLTGNIDVENATKLIEKYLGSIKKDKNMSKWKDVGIRTMQGKFNCTFNKKLETNKSSNFIYYTANIAPNMKNRLIMQLIKGILSNRYLESLRESEGGTYGVSTSTGISNRPVNEGYMQMYFDTDPKVSVKLRNLIQEEIDNVISNGVRTDDFKKSKEILLKNHKEKQRENSYWQTVITTLLKKDGEDLETGYETILNSITNKDIVDMLSTFMKSGNKMTVTMEPK